MRRGIAILVALAALLVTACGAPDELSEQDGVRLALAGDRIEAAIAAERKLHSRAAAERLVARVRRIVASGALEPKQLDEFGLAALGELRLAVPSLVITDRLEIPRQLDRQALRAFLANATRDPSAATKPAASAEVGRIERILADAGAAPDTDVPVVDETVSRYIGDLAAELRSIWPDLADELLATRDEL